MMNPKDQFDALDSRVQQKILTRIERAKTALHEAAGFIPDGEADDIKYGLLDCLVGIEHVNDSFSEE